MDYKSLIIVVLICVFLGGGSVNVDSVKISNDNVGTLQVKGIHINSRNN